MAKTAFIYTDEFLKFDYGPTHPFKTSRLNLAYELIRAHGLLSLYKGDEKDLLSRVFTSFSSS